ncbi:hypothetical protein [Pleomorphomonas sp. JP5]|uniref:hypothetical protein n=1 Tax=Pleomorphomonas sp. JP5 TaxID=2942998 RepID=UPI0020430FD1|nr:hypothetical protein [Pleomorphomonas sp. JP5]MCM5559005.1 hypothetical protein [Pleomorphomonas sp. JP5]
MKMSGMAVVGVVWAAPALAGDCDSWKAGLEQEEEGMMMTASICAIERPDDMLLITCGGEGKLGLRFVPALNDDFPPGGDMNYRSAFVFTSGSLSAEVALRYEAMDGVLAATPRRDSDLVRILKSAGPLSVTDKAGILPKATFTLKGSSNAIGKVERACYS